MIIFTISIIDFIYNTIIITITNNLIVKFKLDTFNEWPARGPDAYYLLYIDAYYLLYIDAYYFILIIIWEVPERKRWILVPDK